MPSRNHEEEFRRILSYKINESIVILSDNDMAPDSAVHSVRNIIKRVRAILRIARFGMESGVYKRENKFFRDIARQFSDLRNATVLIETLDELYRLRSEHVESDAVKKILTQLTSDKYDLYKNTFESSAFLPGIIKSLKAAEERSQQIQFYKIDGEIIFQGVTRVYRRGRKLLAQIRGNATSPHNFHEWRKEVKYLLYHQELLSERMKSDQKFIADYESLDHLAGLLGVGHDASELESWFAQNRVENLAPNLSKELRFFRQDKEGSAIYFGQEIYRLPAKTWLSAVRLRNPGLYD